MKGVLQTFTTFVKAAAIVVCVALCGCRQKELYIMGDVQPDVTESIVDVRFIWYDAENAEVEGMSVYFFPLSEGGKVWNFEIAGMNGGLVSLLPGSYTFLAVNNDLPGIDFTATPTPSNIVAHARCYDDGTLRPSGMVYGAVMDDVRIPVDTCKNDTVEPANHSTPLRPIYTVTASPDSLATVYNIILADVARPEIIENISASISGVAVSLTVDGNRQSEETGTINIPIDIAGNRMTGSTTGLGTPSGTPHFTLTLFAQLTDRRRIAKSLTFDITEQVVKAKHPHNVYITLSGIKFDTETPDEPDDGEDMGMDVDVEGWSSITIDLITGM